LEQRAEAWRPWRAYAAMYLWRMPSQRGERARKPASRKVRDEVVEDIGVLSTLAPAPSSDLQRRLR
jgi:hypothetical protein